MAKEEAPAVNWRTTQNASDNLNGRINFAVGTDDGRNTVSVSADVPAGGDYRASLKTALAAALKAVDA